MVGFVKNSKRSFREMKDGASMTPKMIVPFLR